MAISINMGNDKNIPSDLLSALPVTVHSHTRRICMQILPMLIPVGMWF
jgi:hypothetical protein